MLDDLHERGKPKRLVLADNFEALLKKISRAGSVSDRTHSLILKELQEYDLLPEKPLGASIYQYIEGLIKPLRTGAKETQDFAKNWKGWWAPD